MKTIKIVYYYCNEQLQPAGVAQTKTIIGTTDDYLKWIDNSRVPIRVTMMDVTPYKCVVQK